MDFTGTRRRMNGPTRRCVAADHRPRRAGRAGSWTANRSYRTHGDHFLFNVSRARRRGEPPPDACGARRRPRVARRRQSSLGHRRRRGRRADWIRSSNLGDHSTSARRAALASGGMRSNAHTQVDASAARRPLHRVRHRVEPVARHRLVARSDASACAHRRAARSACRRSPSGSTRIRRTGRAPRSDPRRRGRARPAPTCSCRRSWTRQRHDLRPARPRRDRLAAPTAADRWRTYNIRDVDTRRRRASRAEDVQQRFVRSGGVHGSRRAGRGRYAVVEVRARLRAAHRSPRPPSIAAAGRASPRAASRIQAPHAIDRDERLCAARRAHRPPVRRLRAVRRRNQSLQRSVSGDRRRRDAGASDGVSVAVRRSGSRAVARPTGTRATVGVRSARAVSRLRVVRAGSCCVRQCSVPSPHTRSTAWMPTTRCATASARPAC